MYPKQVISICGDSAVGKNTLIDKIAGETNEIRNRFAITGSFSLHARSDQTRGAKTPLQPLTEMYQPQAETIIFKWQFKDDGEIETLLGLFPHAQHRVILIRRPLDVHAHDFVRIHRKVANSEVKAKEILRVSWEKLCRRFGPESELRPLGVEIELVDGTLPTYPEVTGWNLLEKVDKIESPSPSGNG